MKTLRIAMLHIAPMPGELESNCRMVERTINIAADKGAQWVITPELCLCGYHFASRIGTDWIAPCPDAWTDRIRGVAVRRQITVFFSHPERDPQTVKLHNSMFVIGPDGAIIGTHRKVHVIPVSEAWSSPGLPSTPIFIPPVRVGILICADAYTPHLAKQLRVQGSQMLVSSAAWGPFPHGPEGAWEARSRETGLPLFVCNRTGTDDGMSFVDAESVVVKDGSRLLSFHGHASTMLLFDWDLGAQALVGAGYEQALI